MTRKKGSHGSKRAEESPAAERLQNSSLFNVFIGWSGNQSREVASALHDWLPKVNQFLRPWMSDIDIDKGKRWEEDLAIQLSASRFGILCLTPDNVDSRWVLFEAGAMSRDFDKRVSAYLFGFLSHTDIKPPLAQFQNTIADKDDTKKLVFSINRNIGSPVDDARLAESFEIWWPRLDEKLKKIPRTAPPPRRSDQEIMDEILDHVREIRRTSSQVGPGLTGVTGYGGVGNVTPVRAATSAAYESLAATGRSGPVFKGLAESPLMEVLRKGTADDLPLPPKKK